MLATLPKLRDYQNTAVAAVTAALADGGTGQLRMACGTGKSLTAQRAAEALLVGLLAQRQGSGVVAVVTPSLTLVKQFLDGWRRDADLGPVHCLAVCSDRTVGQGDEAASLADLDVEATTNPDVIKKHLADLPANGLLLIVSTYASAGTLAQGVRAAGRPLDVLICDEAHHLAGNPSWTLLELVTDPGFLPSTRRIYMTATPRLYTDRAVSRGALSMDDSDLFGPVLAEYAFPAAIADGYLDDYRALVTVVEDARVRAVLGSLDDAHDPDQDRGEARNTVVAQVALLRSWQEQGVGRAIAFCDSIRGSKAFVTQLPQVAELLGYDSAMVRALHVDGTMNSQERAPNLAELAAAPDGRLIVVSNARCLGEGVDVPSVDAVLFACPKRSEVDIIQSAGRALRRSPGGRGVAKFILPILLPAAPTGDLVPDVLDGADYEPTWTVIRALRDIDGGLGGELDRLRTSQTGSREPQPEQWADLPEKITVTGAIADPAVLGRITVALIGHTTAPWLDDFAVLRRFHAEHGHFEAPPNVKLANGRTLMSWVTRQRLRRTMNDLPADLVSALDALGFEWAAGDLMWKYMLSRFVTHVEEENTADVPENLVLPGGIRLGEWVSRQRHDYANGQLAVHRRLALEAAGLEQQPLAGGRGEIEPLTTQQVARLAGCSDSYVRRCVTRGTLPGARRLGGGWLIDAGAAATWLAERDRRARRTLTA